MRADDLDVFLRVAQSRSLSATARALNMPKSKIDRMLRRLEMNVRTPLFDRTSHAFRLTEAGAMLQPRALRVVEELEVARAELEDHAAEPKGLLRIASTPAFVQGVLAPLTPAYLVKYSQISIELVVDQQRVDLRTGDIDIAVNIGELTGSDDIAKRLPPTPLWLCASSEYLQARSAPSRPYDLLSHSIVARRPTNSWTLWNETWSETLEVPARVVVEDASACCSVLENGGGLGFLPCYLAQPSIRAGRLTRVLAPWRREPIEVHALFRRGRGATNKVRSFLRSLAVHMQSQHWSD